MGVQQQPCGAAQPRWFWRCLSVRDLLLLLCSFAMLSVYMSYRLTSLHLQPQDSNNGGLSYPSGGALQRSITDHSGNHQRYQRDALAPRSATINSRLLKMLLQLEEEQLRPLRESTRVVQVRGHKAAISRDLPLLSSVLAEHGWLLRAPPWFRRPPPPSSSSYASPLYSAASSVLTRTNSTPENSERGNMIQPSSEWVWLLCLSFSDGDNGACVETADLPQYQAVNKIPGLKNVLLKKDVFCNTMNDARKIPGMKSGFTSLSVSAI